MLVESLGWEDPLKEGMGIHSSILARKIPWQEEPGRLQFMGSQKSWTQLKRLSTQAHIADSLHCTAEINTTL